MPERRRRVPFQQLLYFERGRLAGLRETGWSYHRSCLIESQTCSMGDESSEPASQKSCLTLRRACCVERVVCVRALSCCKTPLSIDVANGG